MKTSKVCPKCQSTEIYSNAHQSPRGDRCSIPISSWVSIYLHTYLCLSCGYTEEYLDPKDLTDPKKIDKIKSTWNKLS